MASGTIQELYEELGIFGKNGIIIGGPLVPAYDLLAVIYMEIMDCKTVGEALDRIDDYAAMARERMVEGMRIAFTVFPPK